MPPAHLLVYWPGFHSCSVVQEKDILTGKLDVGEIVQILYQDGISYDAQVYYFFLLM